VLILKIGLIWICLSPALTICLWLASKLISSCWPSWWTRNVVDQVVEPELSTQRSLYAMAGGLGGQQGGEAASQLTIDMIKAQFLSQPPATLTSFEAWLKAAIEVANQYILAHQIDGTLNIAMSSTLIVALVSKEQADDIGYKPEIEVSCYAVSLQHGLSETLADEIILAINHDHDNPGEACQALVEAAKSAGNVDDITVIVVQME
jgi:serine/threonine protein phosphatase PrpC